MRVIKIKPLKQIADAVLIFIAFSIAYWIRFDDFIMAAEYRPPALLFLVFTSLSLSLFGHYQTNRPSSLKPPLVSIFYGVVLSALLTTMFLYLTKTGETFSRLWFMYTLILSYSLVSTFQIIITQLLKLSDGSKHIIVLGVNNTANSLMKKFSGEESSIKPLKQFPDGGTVSKQNINTVLTDVEVFIETTRKNSLDQPVAEIWITHDVYSICDAQQINAALFSTAAKIVYLAELPPVSPIQLLNIEFIDDYAAIDSDLTHSNRLGALLKFIFDFTLSVIALILLAPILISIAVLIKLDSRGPILYRQSRYGANGKEFLIWKFRTMTVTESTTEFKQATANDKRVTRIGRYLRNTSIDELPQLINVLKGDMSLVGPRPHPNLLNEEYRSKLHGYMQRHNIKPGITGLAQIRGFRGETSSKSDMQNRVNSDLEYIYNWNIILDIKILIQTVLLLLGSRKSY